MKSNDLVRLTRPVRVGGAELNAGAIMEVAGVVGDEVRLVSPARCAYCGCSVAVVAPTDAVEVVWAAQGERDG